MSGKSPDGEGWIADVLAAKGEAKVAIEIQWSSQTLEETLRRQKRYADSGVRCLWLVRRNIKDGFWGVEEVPVARVAQDETGDDYTAYLCCSYNQEQQFDVRQFRQAACSRRLHYRPPAGCRGAAAVWVGPIECWRCKKDTNIVTSVQVDLLGVEPSVLRVSELEGHPAIVRKIMEHIPKPLRVGKIQSRFSKTEGGSCQCRSKFPHFLE